MERSEESRLDNQGEPKFAVAACTALHATFEDDLQIYSSLGIGGIGIWEYKLIPERYDEQASRFQDYRLKATFCFPNVKSVLYGDAFDIKFSQPKDHASRMDQLCAGIRRLAKFDPVAVCLLSGSAGQGLPNQERSQVIDGIQRAADVAAGLGVSLALEVVKPPSGAGFARTIPEALELLAGAGTEHIGLLVDSWHMIAESDLADLQTYTDRIVGIHVSGKRPSVAWTAGMDRRLPGEDVDLPVFLRAVQKAGYSGWYELEIFSDDGTFGTSYPDSLWAVDPAELIEAGRNRFLEVWRQSLETRTNSRRS